MEQIKYYISGVTGIFMSGVYLFGLIIKYSISDSISPVSHSSEGVSKTGKNVLLCFYCCYNVVISVNYCKCDMCRDLETLSGYINGVSHVSMYLD